MTMNGSSFFSAGLAMLALASSAGAQAADIQADCLSEPEISALTVYSMPHLLAATQASCTAQLAPNGFMATNGSAMAQRYAARADAVWPLAKSALVKFAGGSKDKDVAELAKLPDAGMRALLDSIIQQKIGEEIKPKSCRDIERLANAMGRIEPDAAGDLVAAIAVLALGDKDKPKICQAGP